MQKTLEKYFCIYGGGSVRGLAYAGVIKAMDELGIERVGYAGSSVGALIATLDAFGYKYEDITELFENVNFELFKDINFSFGWDIALSKGEIFYNWVKELIEKKYYGDNYVNKGNQPVCFKDLDKDLIIITSNFEDCAYREFSRYTEPDFEIAKAVRISAAMPGLMKSVSINNELLIDGDLLKPAPMWSLSNSLCPESARILEFRLEGSHSSEDIKNSIDYLSALISNISRFSTECLVSRYNQKDKFDYIVLETQNVSLINFNLSKEKQKELVKLGYNATKLYFTQTLKSKKQEMLKYYKILYAYIRKLQERIEKGKCQSLKSILGELFIELTEIKKYIDMTYYDLIIEFKNTLLKNLSKNIFGFYTLEDKEFLITQLKYLGSEIWHIIKNMEEYKTKIEEYNAQNSKV